MATANSPTEDTVGASVETTSRQPEIVVTPPDKVEIPASYSREASIAVTPRPPESSSESEVIHIPSYSRWFSWDNISECEVRFLPEFFSSCSRSRNPRTYLYYRNSIIRKYRENSSRKITFTEVRKVLIGDVVSIRRVFDFLETWGLVNYSGVVTKQQLKWEDKEGKSSGDGAGNLVESSVPARKLCSGCKSLCSIACFSCSKVDLTLCARCYVRGNYLAGVNFSDFRRVEINEETKTDWTEKETLHLLEAIMHYGDDWKRIAEHVGGRSEKECVTRFIKLPFGEEYLGQLDNGNIDNKFDQMKKIDANVELGDTESLPTKRVRLTPLADASNPIVAQAAFLSAVAGVDVAEAAAQAAVTALSAVDNETCRQASGHLENGTSHKDDAVNGNITSERAHEDVKSALEKEEQDAERAFSDIIEVQMKEIQEKVDHFEEVELRMEKKWQQLQQMKNLLFSDELKLLFHRAPAPIEGERGRGRTQEADVVRS